MSADVVVVACDQGRNRGGTKSEAECELIVHHMRSLPALINRALDQKDQFERAAHKLAQARDILFLGRGAMYPLAHEGA